MRELLVTRFMHAAELSRAPEGMQFDPLVEGRRYGLPPELLLTLWERACVEASDHRRRSTSPSDEPQGCGPWY